MRTKHENTGPTSVGVGTSNFFSRWIESWNQKLDDPDKTLADQVEDAQDATNNQLWSDDSDDESGYTDCHLPEPVFNLFVYLAQNGVNVKDLFRRPGNIAQMKDILQRFAPGHHVDWADYNIHTVATVAKKLLLSIPGGLFGPEGEHELLNTSTRTGRQQDCTQLHDLTPNPVRSELVSPMYPGKCATPWNLDNNLETKLHWSYGTLEQIYDVSKLDEHRIRVFEEVLNRLPPTHRELAMIVFGILHQLLFNAALTTATQTLDNTNGTVPLITLAEGVVKSVAGSIFHTCTSSVLLIDQTTQVLQSLVLCFPVMSRKITQFYLNVLTNRCRCKPSNKSTLLCYELRTKMGGPTMTYHPCTPTNPSRSGSTRLLHAAGRLFCFPCPNHHICQAKHVRSGKSALGHKPQHASPPKHSVGVIGQEPGPRAKRTVEFAEKEPTNAERMALLGAVGPTTNSGNIEGSQQQQQTDSSDALIDLPKSDKVPDINITAPDSISPPTVVTLRRHQSRYRSLRRRQMENLARRAEWFLSPTVLPSVSFTPTCRRDTNKLSSDPKSTEVNRSALNSTIEDYDLCCSHPTDGFINTSTMSLLELDNTLKQELNCSSHYSPYTDPSSGPRVLFSSSTSELEHRELTSPTQPDSKNLLLHPGQMFGQSFISLHSAPSPRAYLTLADPIAPMPSFGKPSPDYLIPPSYSLISTTGLDHFLNHPSSYLTTKPGKLSAMSGPDLLLHTTNYELVTYADYNLYQTSVAVSGARLSTPDPHLTSTFPTPMVCPGPSRLAAPVHRASIDWPKLEPTRSRLDPHALYYDPYQRRGSAAAALQTTTHQDTTCISFPTSPQPPTTTEPS